MDEMTWYEDVACLLTRSMTAPLIESLDLDHYTGVAKGHAVIADDLSPGCPQGSSPTSWLSTPLRLFYYVLGASLTIQLV